MGKGVELLLIRSAILGNEVAENQNGVLHFNVVKDSPLGKNLILTKSVQLQIVLPQCIRWLLNLLLLIYSRPMIIMK